MHININMHLGMSNAEKPRCESTLKKKPGRSHDGQTWIGRITGMFHLSFRFSVPFLPPSLEPQEAVCIYDSKSLSCSLASIWIPPKGPDRDPYNLGMSCKREFHGHTQTDWVHALPPLPKQTGRCLNAGRKQKRVTNKKVFQV